MVFKTTCVDTEKPLREGVFFFARRTLFPPLDERNTRDKAKGLCVFLEGHIGELDARCLSTISRGQDSKATGSVLVTTGEQYYFARRPVLVPFTSRYGELAEGCEHSAKSRVKAVGLFLGEEWFTEVA